MYTLLQQLSIADLRGLLIVETKALLQLFESTPTLDNVRELTDKIKTATDILLKKEIAASCNKNLELNAGDWYSLIID